ncbi:hypothetical protein LCGC14_1041270 [marine sediment metagenome]|uniref:Uncharacterized protein n=1 Tax=marine sediment metagenome TaxID=412755 RepID=A0A0F9MW50_9ZZZZ
MKEIALTLVASALLIGLTIAAIPVVAQAANTCSGYQPYKPYVPYHCDDLVLMCTCDYRMQNCSWEWVCVKN